MFFSASSNSCMEVWEVFGSKITGEFSLLEVTQSCRQAWSARISQATSLLDFSQVEYLPNRTFKKFSSNVEVLTVISLFTPSSWSESSMLSLMAVEATYWDLSTKSLDHVSISLASVSLAFNPLEA